MHRSGAEASPANAVFWQDSLWASGRGTSFRGWSGEKRKQRRIVCVAGGYRIGTPVRFEAQDHPAASPTFLRNK
jgi:hypothetical protein